MCFNVIPMTIKCYNIIIFNLSFTLIISRDMICTGQVGLGVGSWPSNRVTEGSNPK